MATYNWTYKFGQTNKYNIVVPTTANDAIRPTGFFYVAPWGNDVTGNGSRQLPYRTIMKAGANVTSSSTIVLASGVYREYMSTMAATSCNIVGDGNVIIDQTLISTTFLSNAITFGSFYNVTFRGALAVSMNFYQNGYIDCTFINVSITTVTTSYWGNTGAIMQGCVFIGATLRIGALSYKTMSNNTFYNCNVLFISSMAEFSVLNLIFYQCNVSFGQLATFIDWCLFYQCNFRFNTTALLGSTYYPSVPTGYTYYSAMSSIRSANTAAFGAGYKNFDNSIIADPVFNNLPVFDFTLDPSSPAKNLSYFGSYVGAFSIAQKLLVRATSSASSFDNASAVNLTIADDSLTLTSTASPASIEAIPVANLIGRTYGRLPVLSLNADRNGQFVNTTVDLSASPLSAGAVPINTPYIVQVGSITYNGTVYNVGDRFTSAATSMSFTTSFGGVIAEILQAPSRQAIEARFNTGTTSTIDNTGTIVTGTWYYVTSGSATYNGNTYATGSFFKGQSGITTFTGTGILRPTFASSDPYFLFEIGQPVTTNNTGNVITGAISKGNGSSDFDRTPANIFSVNLKFIQLKYTINVANLTPQ